MPESEFRPDEVDFISSSSKSSAFTYRQLHQLREYSTTTPLRVIALIDLDAFYAQCEMVRLGLPESTPLAVRQWNGLIAINYAAREFGLTRHITVAEALERCPDLVVQHVATWKAGDDGWAYRGRNNAFDRKNGNSDEDGSATVKVCSDSDNKNAGDEDEDDPAQAIATQKVSLDLYREQSRRILALIKSALPPSPMQRVEKASVDEMFIDLSAQVHSILLETYPDLLGRPPPYDDPTECLPRPPTTALDWKSADVLASTGDDADEEHEPDWDDFCLQIGSEIVQDLRRKVFDQLHFTCSAGIAGNKMLAKLGSGHKKPNAQTVIRRRAAANFIKRFKFTKIRNLGGKLGDDIVAKFGTDAVSELLTASIDELHNALGPDTGTWVYRVLRGDDGGAEVVARTEIKSILSAKSFRPAISSFEQAVLWLRIFAADIYARCIDNDVQLQQPQPQPQPALGDGEYDTTHQQRCIRRRPRSITLHYRHGGQTRSRQSPVPTGAGRFDAAILLELARNLLARIVSDGAAWPCANLSLSVAGFDDGAGMVGNMGIGGFLVRGEEARDVLEQQQKQQDPGGLQLWQLDGSSKKSAKRRKISPAPAAGGIEQFLQPGGAQSSRSTGEQSNHTSRGVKRSNSRETTPFSHQSPPNGDFQLPLVEGGDHTSLRLYCNDDENKDLCPDCSISLAQMPISARTEHSDWHFAQQLEIDEQNHQQHSTSSVSTAMTTIRKPQPPPPLLPPSAGNKFKSRNSSSTGALRGTTTRVRGRGRGRGATPAPAMTAGQSKLAFGSINATDDNYNLRDGDLRRR